MNIGAFTGRAEAYVKARPGYPKEAMEYIRTIVPQDAVFADIGAGTGKFTELLAQYGYKIFAVEPNADMREQLVITLKPFNNIEIVDGTAEATTLSENSVDVIISAQVLNRVDINGFQVECQRIGKASPIVITLFNGGNELGSRYKKSTSAFYKNPIIQKFSNPQFYTRDMWHLYFMSMEGVPLPSDNGYEEWTAELNEKFDKESADGILRLDEITYVFSERLEWVKT